MTKWEESIGLLNYIGVTPFDVPEDIFKLFCESAYASKEIGYKMLGKLAGRIREEHSIKATVGIHPRLNEYIMSCCSHGNIREIISKVDVLTSPAPIVISDIWTNFQKKHEFNPLHDHTGFASFIVFVKIPYDLEEEENFFGEGKDGEHSPTSKLAFLKYCPILKHTNLEHIRVDKSFEGKMLFFGANHYHQVYPFYTSDDYRITISGNLKFEVN